MTSRRRPLISYTNSSPKREFPRDHALDFELDFTDRNQPSSAATRRSTAAAVVGVANTVSAERLHVDEVALEPTSFAAVTAEPAAQIMRVYAALLTPLDASRHHVLDSLEEIHRDWDKRRGPRVICS